VCVCVCVAANKQLAEIFASSLLRLFSDQAQTRISLLAPRCVGTTNQTAVAAWGSMELASGNDHETLHRLVAENNALYQDLVLLQEDRSYLQSVITVGASAPRHDATTAVVCGRVRSLKSTQAQFNVWRHSLTRMSRRLEHDPGPGQHESPSRCVDTRDPGADPIDRDEADPAYL